MSHACQLMLPRCTCGIPPLPRSSDSINMVASASNSFRVPADLIPRPASPSASLMLTHSLVPLLQLSDSTPSASSVSLDSLGRCTHSGVARTPSGSVVSVAAASITFVRYIFQFHPFGASSGILTSSLVSPVGYISSGPFPFLLARQSQGS